MQMRLEEAGGADTTPTSDRMLVIKPGTMLGQDAFLNNINGIAAATGNEAEVCAELETMIAEVEELGVPPAETGMSAGGLIYIYFTPIWPPRGAM